MNERDPEREPTSLDDETPGSQGEIESGSEGDFTGPDNPDDAADDGSPNLDEAPQERPRSASPLPGPTATD